MPPAPPLARAAPAAARSAPPARTIGHARASPVLPLYLQGGATRVPLPQGAIAARRTLDAQPAPSEQAPEERPEASTAERPSQDQAAQDQAAQDQAQQGEAAQ